VIRIILDVFKMPLEPANPPEDKGCGMPDPHPAFFKESGDLKVSFSVITHKLQVSYENLPPPKKGQEERKEAL
jgi:hypothetical protein